MLVAISISILNSALLVGNEFAIAAFVHPTLSRQDHRAHLSAIQRFARFYGGLMPLWMGVTAALQAAIAVAAWFEASLAFPWLFAAALLWAIAIPFSLIFPVPLNNQVKAWDLEDLPLDWENVRRRWDFYNWLRVILLLAAFVTALIGFKLY